MQKNNPLVSVVMNCHNGETYLHNAIESVIDQTYKNWELIFWDNNSTDNSKKILNKFTDKRIKYFKSDKFLNLYDARNHAISKATGKFVCFLDTDDWWIKEKLEKQINLILSKENLALVYSNHFIFDDNTKKKKFFSKKKLPSGKTTQHLLDFYSIGILTVLIRREIFEKQLFDKEYEIIGDFDFFLNLSLRYNFECNQEPLAYYRLHKKNLSIRKIDLQIKEIENWLKKIRKLNKFSSYSIKGVIYNLQTLKIKQNLFNNNKFLALKEILKPPFNIKKYKFILFLLFKIK